MKPLTRARALLLSFSLLSTSFTHAIHAGDLAAFTLRVDQDIAHGITAPEMRDTLINHAKQQIQRGEVMRLINTDPIHAKRLLEERDPHGKPTQFDAIDEATRYTLINHATRNSSRLAAQTYETLAARIADGEVIGSKELDELVARRLMTPKHAKDILKLQTTAKFDTTAYAQLHNAILAYDPALDRDNTQHAELLGAILSMPSALATELRDLLNEKRKGSASPLNNPAAQEILERMDEGFEYGLYGDYEEYRLVQNKDENGKSIKVVKKVVNQARYNTALANLARAKDEVRRFVQANPTASGSEIIAHLRITQGKIMGTAASEGIVGHPMGAVKEQSSNLYAQKVGEDEGFARKLGQSVSSAIDTAPPSLDENELDAVDLKAPFDPEDKEVARLRWARAKREAFELFYTTGLDGIPKLFKGDKAVQFREAVNATPDPRETIARAVNQLFIESLYPASKEQIEGHAGGN